MNKEKLTRMVTNSNVSSLLSNFIFAVSGFFSFILLSQNLPPALFGSWILYISLATMADLIRTGLTRSAIIHYASGQEEYKTREIGASGLLLDIIMIGSLSVVLLSAYGIGKEYWGETINAFLLWYPLLAVSNSVWNNVVSMLQAKGVYHKTIVMRLINTLSFLVFCIVLVITGYAKLETIIIANIISNVLSSLYVIIKGWSSLGWLKKAQKTEMRKQWNYGKYAVASTLSSSLLKSADTYIIGMSPLLGTTGIAVFSIPFKVVEILEIPIGSLSLNAFNRISVAAKEENKEQVRALFVRYTLLITCLILPLFVGILLFPNLILTILGGKQYSTYFPIMTMLLFLIIPYTLLLVYDRLLGVTLEGICLPRLNMIKTFLMVLCNIVGDLIAVFVFQSIIGVALASIFFTLVGILSGSYMLPANLRVSLSVFKEEWRYLVGVVRLKLRTS